MYQPKPKGMVTEERRLPFAVAGDEVILESGVYREWVNPINGYSVFSVIEDNHIHHINKKRIFLVPRLTAAIDVIFRRNHIHHCSRGLCLDWQAHCYKKGRIL